MAHTPVPEVNTGDPAPSSEYLNTYVVNNWIVGVPDEFTAKGELMQATAADAADPVTIGSNGTLFHANSAQTTGGQWRLPEYGSGGRSSTTTDISDSTETLWPGTATERFDIDSSSANLSYTARATGYYFVSVSADLASGGGWSEDEITYIRLYVNTTPGQIIAAKVAQGTHAQEVAFSGAALVYLTSGQVLKPYIYQETGASFTPVLNIYDFSVFRVK